MANRRNDGKALICVPGDQHTPTTKSSSPAPQPVVLPLPLPGAESPGAVLGALQHAPHSFLSKTRWEGACLVWTGSRDQKGYGTVTHGGVTKRAHVVAYQWLHGPLPPETFLHHRCETKACINPDHLLPVSRLEHAALHRVTHCKRGHPFDEVNTFVYQRDDQVRRACRTCKQQWHRARRCA